MFLNLKLRMACMKGMVSFTVVFARLDLRSARKFGSFTTWNDIMSRIRHFENWPFVLKLVVGYKLPTKGLRSKHRIRW